MLRRNAALYGASLLLLATAAQAASVQTASAQTTRGGRPPPGVIGRHQRPASPPGALQQKLVNVEISGTETGLRIGEIQIPHPLEYAAESDLPDITGRGQEPGPPLLQGACVVRAHREI